MAEPIPSLLDELRSLGDERLVVTDREVMASWETDWRGRWTGRAAALVQPSSTRAVAAVVRAAGRHGVALVPQGGNSSMVGGATPGPGGDQLILSLRRMNRVRSVGARRATIEAGVVLQHLHGAAAAVGARFPLTLGARGTATVGGLVSTAAGGTQVLRHGTMRRLVEGLEVVLADGTVFSTLDPLAKDSRGPDLTPLFVGAEGTLGVVTAATVRLAAQPAARAVAWLAVASPVAALDVLRSLETRLPERVEGFELIARATLAAAMSHVASAHPPVAADHPWHVLVEAVGDHDVGERLADALAAQGDRLLDAALASSEAQADALWALRDGLSAAEKARGPGLSFDLSVPVERLPDFLTAAEAEVPAAFPGHTVSGFGHLGDGNIHLHVRAPVGADAVEWAGTTEPLARFVHDRLADAGGSISAEHGIGQMKRDGHARLGDPVRLALLAKLKAVLDPTGILNPGKLHP